MKNKLFILFFLLFLFSTNAQNAKSIDTINEVSLKRKLENASVLSTVFLKNAQDAKSINYHLGEAESYSNLSLVYYYQGKYEKDLYYSLRAISIYEKYNENEKLAIEYGELGYRMKKRNLSKALFYMQKGIKIAEKNHFQKPVLSLYNNYGVLKEMQKQLDSALYFYNKGLVIKDALHDSVGIPYSLNNIAGIYVLQKQFNKAKTLYDKSIAMRIKLKDQIGIIENLTYFGDLYFAKKEYQKAIEYYLKSNQKALKFNYINTIQYNYEKISECNELIGNTTLAFENYKKHIQFKDSLLSKETNAKIAELEVKYETNKKEKQLLQKEAEAKKKTTTIIILSLLAFFIAIIGFLIYRQQRLKNKQQQNEFELQSAITQIENQNKLHEQRLAISRDLHDNIGAQLTFIISSVENLKFDFPTMDNVVKNHLTKISDFAKTTIIELRDTIWAMNASEFTFDDLSSRIYNFIEKAQSVKEQTRFKITVSDKLKNTKFSSLEGVNLYRTLQESVNNAIKYAEATEISVQVQPNENGIIIEISDNGKGFDLDTIDLGNGIVNMQKRIEEIGGVFNIQSKLAQGTHITISLKK